MQRRVFLNLGLAAAAVPALRTVHAQSGASFSRPLTLIVPFAAGGGGDTIGRLLAKALGERLGQAVVVDNKPGAGGTIGAAHVLKAAPDGYTLLNMSSTYAIQAAVQPKLPFDPVADMQPIIMVARDAAVLVVHPESPLKDVRGLVAEAKRQPGKLTHGSAGVGSSAHLAMEDLAHRLGIDLLHVPYKGSSQVFNDLIGRNVSLMLTSAVFAAPHIKAGKLRALGVAGRQRVASLPDVPTFIEQGVDYTSYDWKAIAGPRGMPRQVVATLNRELNEVLRQPALLEKFASEGTTIVGGTPEQMMETVQSEIQRWKALVKAANIKLD